MPTPEFLATFGRLAANHLWQSTGFAAVSVLLALALRGNHARVRHLLWLTASVKFLIPFSVLTSIGGSLGRWLIPAAPVSRLPLVMEQIVQPFAPIQDAALSVAPIMKAPATPGLLPTLLLALWFCGFVAVLLYGWVRWRRVAAAVRSSAPITEGRELEAFRRIEWSGSSVLPRLVSSKANLEPGAFGFFRPVVCLPAGIADRLNDAELEAILTHELCHIRRRDNLTAIMHMAVEAIFWFHPLVWWLGLRLTEERERACDEEVVRMGGEPQVYAESILKVCEFYIASPVACTAGVTGGELKKRIEGIMMNRFARAMGLEKKLMLAAAAVAAVTGPFAFGIVSARAQTAPRPSLHFDVVSVKLTHTGQGGPAMSFQ
jgi:beta-lactamase regulating signal transducer with metallopeptidase domain